MADKTTIKRGRKKKQQEGPNNEPSGNFLLGIFALIGKACDYFVYAF